MKNIRLVKYQTLSFSDKLSSDRIDRAQDTFGEIATRRFLCFSLYLLGLNRQDIGKSIDLPAETVKSIIKSLMLDGISALEDRRRRPFAPIPQVSPELPSITIKQEGQLIVVDLGVQDRQIKLNQHDQLQMRTILLTMLNSGLLTNKQVADAISLTPPHTAALAQQLMQNGAVSLVDKREGQKHDYRVTPEIKAEIIQQFAVDIITGGPTSGVSISDQLKERCQITISERTVRHHLGKLGLPTIKHSLPQLVTTVKKKLQELCLKTSSTLPWPEQTTDKFSDRMLLRTRVEQRAAIVALSKGGFKSGVISAFTGTHPKTAHRWMCRVAEGATLIDLSRCGRPRTFSEGARLMTIAVYCQQSPPLPGLHLWSLRDAQRYFKDHTDSIGRSISHSTIQRILLEHALRPHRHKYYLQITDPDFFPKMAHIVECYLNPPQYLYCFDECTCIQALKRLTPNLPTGRNQAVLEDFEYQRNGVSDLLAFLNTATGTVYGRCTNNHDRHTLCEVFISHVESHPSDAAIHYIMDNLTTHYHDDFCQTVAELSGINYSPLATGHERRQWLQSEDKRIVVHFIPFHASWLNMVEIWFGILKRKCLKYDHFTSVKQLRIDITGFINTWNGFFAHPFKWSYIGKDLYAKAVRRFSRLLSIQTDQMDSKFLTSQLLLMSNIADNYIKSIPVADWFQLLDLAAQSDKYISKIIEMETGPIRHKKAHLAYTRFLEAVIDNDSRIARAT